MAPPKAVSRSSAQTAAPLASGPNWCGDTLERGSPSLVSRICATARAANPCHLTVMLKLDSQAPRAVGCRVPIALQVLQVPALLVVVVQLGQHICVRPPDFLCWCIVGTAVLSLVSFTFWRLLLPPLPLPLLSLSFPPLPFP